MRTIYESFVLLVIGQFIAVEQGAQHQNTSDANLEQGKTQILADIMDQLGFLLCRPVVSARKVVLIFLWQIIPKRRHALDDSSGVAHDGVPRLHTGRIHRIDDIGLDISHRGRQLKVL